MGHGDDHDPLENPLESFPFNDAAVGRFVSLHWQDLAGTALDAVLLALAGWGREAAQLAMSTAVTRGRCLLFDTFWSFSSGLREIMASVHSCSFHLGQAAGPIAHGFARLHPDRVPGLVISAVLVAIAYAVARLRCQQRFGLH